MTDPERQRMKTALSTQGIVYAAALVAVLVMFLFASLGPDPVVRPSTRPGVSEPPLFPGAPGR